MRLSSTKKRLGDILVDVGIITPQQLKAALNIQSQSGGKLGTILSQMGVINEEVMLAFLGKQCGVPYVSLSEYGEISKEVISSLSDSIVRHQVLIPIKKENNILTIAMSDPFNVFAIDDIKLMTGYDAEVVIASEAEIKAAIDKYYANKSEIENILISMSSVPDSPVTSSKNDLSFDNQLDSLVAEAVKSGVSAIHFEPELSSVRLRYRINGTLHQQTRFTKEFSAMIIHRLKQTARFGLHKDSVPQTSTIKRMVNNKNINLNITLLPTVLGEKVILEIVVPESLCLNLKQLGFEPDLLSIYEKEIETPGKLILVSGPAESGKTTTIYSTLASLNFPERELVAIEKTVEHVIPGITQIQIKTGEENSFSSVLEFYGKHRADVIMLSEIPDQKTAELAAATAISGSTVIACLTSNTAIETVSRFINMGVHSNLALSAISMVLNQRLLQLICPDCKEGYQISSSNLVNACIELKTLHEGDKIEVWRGKGCQKCNFTGYSGRTAVFEILQIDDELRKLISENPPKSIIQKRAEEKHFMTLHKAALIKVRAGIISVEEMLHIIK